MKERYEILRVYEALEDVTDFACFSCVDLCAFAVDKIGAMCIIVYNNS